MGVVTCVALDGEGVLIDVGLCIGPCIACGRGARGGVAVGRFRVCRLLFLGERKVGDGIVGVDVNGGTGAGEAKGEVAGGGEVAGCPLDSVPVSFSSTPFSLAKSPSRDLILEIMKALSSVESGYMYLSFY